MRKLAIVGESVFALLPESKGQHKLDTRWTSGIFLGVLESSMEYLIGTRHGVMKVRTMRRKPDLKDRWNLPELKGIRGIPWEPYPGDSLTMKDLRPRIPSDKDQSIPARPEPASAKGRRIGFPIKLADMNKCGVTYGCRGCTQLKKGSYGHHTQECKARLEKLLREAGDPRIHTFDTRFEEELGKAQNKEEPNTESTGEPNAKKHKVAQEEVDSDDLFGDFESSGEEETAGEASNKRANEIDQEEDKA